MGIYLPNLHLALSLRFVRELTYTISECLRLAFLTGARRLSIVDTRILEKIQYCHANEHVSGFFPRQLIIIKLQHS
jgi:hypothetical protein